MDLEVIVQELIPIRHEGKLLPEAIDLNKVLRKLEVTLTQIISRHHKLTELMKEDDTKSTSSNHSGPTKATTQATSIKLLMFSIPKFDGGGLNCRIFWEQFRVLIYNRPQLSDAGKLAYLKRRPERWSCRVRHPRDSTDSGTYDEAIECLLNQYDQPRLID